MNSEFSRNREADNSPEVGTGGDLFGWEAKGDRAAFELRESELSVPNPENHRSEGSRDTELLLDDNHLRMDMDIPTARRFIAAAAPAPRHTVLHRETVDKVAQVIAFHKFDAGDSGKLRTLVINLSKSQSQQP